MPLLCTTKEDKPSTAAETTDKPKTGQGDSAKTLKNNEKMHKYASMKKTSIVFHCNPL